jgi:hypothetical protein
VVKILQLSNDGNDLAPGHLFLCQQCANAKEPDPESDGELDYVLAALERGDYKKPWLLGVEHLTKDHQGYVYWKGKEVEHYTFHEDYDHSRERAAALQLARRCRALEHHDKPVNTNTAVWLWQDDWYID